MPDLDLHKISETSSKITLGWTPVPGAAGYRFQSSEQAPAWSHTWDGQRDQVVFALADWYKVQALGVQAEDIYPPPVTPQPPTGTGLLGWGTTEQAKARGDWKPTREYVVTSTTDFWNRWNGLQPGDRLVCNGFAITGQNFLNKHIGGRAEVIGSRWTGNGPRNGFCFDAGLTNIHLYDVDIQNTNGRGWRLTDSVDASIWGVTKNCPGGGGGHWSNSKESFRVDLRGLIQNCGDKSYDDAHPENPGTGLHGFYLAGGQQYTTGGLFSFDIQDQKTGAAIQIGHHIRDATIYASGKRCSFPAVSSVAGNTLQFWGGLTDRILVPYVYGEDNAGRVVEAEPGSNDNSQVTVEYGRGKNCLLALYPGAPYADRYFRPRPKFVYQDIDPA